ncbi:hypothetical protein ECG_09675 [Echinococcus granulosus]|nr:hypothetical protein ECG_09675 [Echinococcus granulosus]
MALPVLAGQGAVARLNITPGDPSLMNYFKWSLIQPTVLQLTWIPKELAGHVSKFILVSALPIPNHEPAEYRTEFISNGDSIIDELLPSTNYEFYILIPRKRSDPVYLKTEFTTGPAGGTISTSGSALKTAISGVLLLAMTLMFPWSRE